MQTLIKQEQFEMEILEKLNSSKLLDKLILGGGTMLRLCCGLNRFSIDLDFWIVKKIDFDRLFKRLTDCLKEQYTISDSANKFYTLLFELRSNDYPRSIKIEIRKENKKITTEQMIAYSRYSNTQVLLKAVSLKDMMAAKIDAFINRKEIRDVFDMEFLIKKGIELDGPRAKLEKVLKGIDSLKKKDYTVKLGSILEAKERRYYLQENFKILKQALVDLGARNNPPTG